MKKGIILLKKKIKLKIKTKKLQKIIGENVTKSVCAKRKSTRTTTFLIILTVHHRVIRINIGLMIF
jgi:hypothetical protein